MKKEPSQYEIFNNFYFFGFDTKEELIEKYVNNDIDSFIKQQIDHFIEEEDELGFHVSTKDTTTKILKSIDGERYTIFSNGGYTIVQNYTFFSDFEKYGFDKKEDFIFYIGKTNVEEIPADLRKKISQENEAIEKKRKKKRQTEGYKEKLRAKRLMRLRKQVEKEYPDLSTREKEKLVFKLYDSHNVIVYKWLKTLKDNEREDLKKKLIFSKDEIIKILQKIEMPSFFDTFDDVRKYISSIDISQCFSIRLNKFNKCPFFKNNRSVLILKNKHYRIVSIDDINKIGYVFDFIDLLALYDINVDDVIKVKQITVKQLEEIKEGKQKIEDEKIRYKNFINYVTSNKFKQEYPILYKYIEKHIHTLEEIVNVGIENINNTLYFKENKAVFFASSRYVAERMNMTHHQNIAKKINLFCVLGFFRKIFQEELPEALIYQDNREYSVNYLQLRDNIDFKKAEEIAKLLIDSKVSIKNFTKKNIANVLGEEIAEKVFHKRKKEKVTRNKDNVFEEAFVEDFENELDILRERDIEDTFKRLTETTKEAEDIETEENVIMVITNNPEQLKKGSVLIGNTKYVFIEKDDDDDDFPF